MSKPCASCEYIIDIYFADDITHIWTKTRNGSTNHYPLAYHPIIYIAADKADKQHQGRLERRIDEIVDQVKRHPSVVAVSVVSRYLSSSHDETSVVCKVEIVSPKHRDDVVNDFNSNAYNQYNIDLNLRQQFFLDTGSYPMGACHINLGAKSDLDSSSSEFAYELESIEMHDDAASVHYTIPPLKIMDVKIQIKQAGAFPKFEDRLLACSLTIYDFAADKKITDISLKGHEFKILKQLVTTIQEHDPDFLNIPNGDKFVLNYLAHRSAYYNFTHQFCLGRLNIPLYPRKKGGGQTYMTYGQIMRRDPVWYLPGRVHIDAENSFFMYEAGLPGLIDLSRMGGVPPERTSRSSIGSALTGIEFQINTATLPSTLVPPNKATGEQFKEADKLLIADNGGLIYPAHPGVFDRVWAIDFTSLYPMIMANHNIGSETVLCDHTDCKETNIVPETNYHVCHKRVGVVPKTMFQVLQKRLMLKMTKKKDLPTFKTDRFKGMDSAMKWILVSCFGYLGFKNARWGSIESHQCVTAYARRYLLEARQIAESHGFEVVAGITDSLFVRAHDPSDDRKEKVEHLIQTITRKTGVPLDMEGKFQWVVFCNVKEYTDVAALNRYFGFFNTGDFKLRGIKHRQRRACSAEKKFQEEILELLSTASTLEQFKKLIPKANKVLLAWKEKLMKQEVAPKDLMIKLKSTKGAGGYIATSTVQALTVKKYKQQGQEVLAGQSFYFVVSDDSKKTVDRVTIGPNIDENTYYDSEWYCKLFEVDFLELLEAPQRQFFGEIKYDGNPNGVMTELSDFFSNDATDFKTAENSKQFSI